MRIAIIIIGVLIVLAAFLWPREKVESAKTSTGAIQTLPIQPEPERIPGHAEIMQTLKTEAASKGLYWKVWCTAYYEKDAVKYSAIATEGSEFNIYYEDGAKPYWAVHNFNSPDDAAYALILALHEEPNRSPQHKKAERKTECGLEFSGGPQLQVAK